MNSYNPLNVSDVGTLFEGIPDDLADVDVNLTNTATVLKKPEKPKAIQSSRPWWYPKLDSSWLCRNPCSPYIEPTEFLLQTTETALVMETG